MYTKAELKQQLQNAGLTGKETILIHSSMKAIGEVESGADTVLDAWMEYFADGLLLLPTHTWANVNAEHPVYDYRSTPSCVGLLTNLFRLRAGVVRSLHPTHSLAGFGKGAAEYLAGEDENNTPCTPGGAYDRLKDCVGKILLVGVGHERNTYIHSVEEVLNVPNRLAAEPMELLTILPDGSKKKVKLKVTVRPGKPVNFIVQKKGKKKAVFSWDPVAGAAGYEVAQADSQKGKYTTIWQQKKKTSVELKISKDKYYKVRAWYKKDGELIYGAFSKAIKAS